MNEMNAQVKVKITGPSVQGNVALRKQEHLAELDGSYAVVTTQGKTYLFDRKNYVTTGGRQ